VNISQEDAIKYGITTRDLETIKALPSVSLVNPKAPSRILYQDADAYPESVRKWIRSEIAKYEKLMERVDPDEINKLSFHAKFFYRFAYKRPSDRVIAQLKTKFHA
jgi:hypothetical protein